MVLKQHKVNPLFLIPCINCKLLSLCSNCTLSSCFSSCLDRVKLGPSANSLAPVSVTPFLRVYFHLDGTTSLPPGASFDVLRRGLRHWVG